jgi:nucleoside-diphosphate-sugar epimerase
MRILVTGHNGYIGTLLVPKLLERGYDIMGIDSNLFQACVFGSKPTPVPSIQKDIRDISADDLSGYNALIHLAALSNDPLGELIPEITFEINYVASVRLAEAAKEAGINRFIFSSSCSVYGASGDREIDENSELNPITIYAKSKARAEKDIASLANSSFSPIIFRNATAYGVSPMLRFDLAINNLTAWAFTSGKVLLKSDGTSWRPFVHIEDICDAYIKALEADRADIHNGIYNIGLNEENYQIRDVAETVKAIIPDSYIETADGAKPDRRSYNVNFKKAEELFTGDFKWNVKAGVEELYNYYKMHGLLLEDFEGTRYKRIDHLRYLLSAGKIGWELRWK